MQLLLKERDLAEQPDTQARNPAYAWSRAAASAMPTPSWMDWAECPAVEQDPQRFSGALVFRGTRIPVAALFQNLEDGVSLAEFVELFPGVTTEQARLVLEHAAKSTAVALA